MHAPTSPRALRASRLLGPLRSHGGGLVALGLLGLLTGALTPREEPSETTPRLDDGRPARVEGLDTVGCASCHGEIAAEWAESLHALAWIDPHYQEAIARKRRPASCHGCHIPQRLHAGDLSKKPRPRTEEEAPLHLGITCNACHGGEGEQVLGPWGEQTDAHASVRSPSFEGAGRDVLCSSCHSTNIGPVLGVARDFNETGQAKQGKSCVGCHMPVEYRSAAVSPEGVASEERLGRSHRILGPWDNEFLTSAFAFSAETSGDRTRVSIVNQAGHRVPGLQTRSFTIKARLLDASGEPTDTRGELSISSRSHLPADGVVVLELEGRGAEVELELLHHAPGVARPITVTRQRLKPMEGQR